MLKRKVHFICLFLSICIPVACKKTSIFSVHKTSKRPNGVESEPKYVPGSPLPEPAAPNSDISAEKPTVKAEAPKESNPNTGGIAPLEFDESVNRAIARSYWQSESSLKDLFANEESIKGSSMLCWPAILAYEMYWLANEAELKLEGLKQLLASVHTQTPEAETRYFFNTCGTDQNRGTTVPRAASCIANTLQAGGYDANIEIYGLDAQWAAFGMFPIGTKAEFRAFSLQELKNLITGKKQLVLMLGFYRKPKPESDRWLRESGHFVSAVGYRYKKEWQDQKIILNVINPALDRRRRQPEQLADMMEVQEVDDTVKPSLPQQVHLKITGDNFDYKNFIIVLESVIAFSIKPQIKSEEP